MTDRLVPTIRTTCTPAALYAALRADWPSVVTDAPATRAALLTLVAHWSFETGYGQSAWCWNLGNVKHVSGDGCAFFQIRCNEYVNGVLTWYDPPHPATSFRAYDSLEAGVRDYLVALRGRFGRAWPAVEAGDPAAFCHELKLAGYYTDDEAHYTRSVVACFHRLDTMILPEAAPEPLKPDTAPGLDAEAESVGAERTDVQA